VLTGSGGRNDPRGLAFGPHGNLYVSSYVTHQVQRYDGRTGVFEGGFFTGDVARLLFLRAEPPLSAGPPAG
jgi:hypothetical protein